MSEDRIIQLLRQADRAAGPPPVMPDDLAARVRRRAHRRRMTSLGAATAAAVVVLAAGTATLVSHLVSDHPQVASRERGPQDRSVARQNGRQDDVRDEVARLRADVDRLRAEANSRMAVIRQMATLLQHDAWLAGLERELAKPDPLEETQRQLDRAAHAILRRAARLDHELNQRGSAIDAYRRAIELFPQTRWADVARARLSEIEQSKGDRI